VAVVAIGGQSALWPRFGRETLNPQASSAAH
jgi:hypothetical protein